MWPGACVRRADVREIDEKTERGSRHGDGHAHAEDDRADPITLPCRADNEAAIRVDREHGQIKDRQRRAGRRSDRQ